MGYTAGEKTEAIALCLEVGMAEAHDRTGIPKPTLSRWLTPQQRAEMAERFQRKTQAATEAARLTWLQRKATVCLDLADLVELGISHATTYLREGKPDKARSCMTPVGVGIDKLLILHGEANSIVRTPWDPKAVTEEAAPRAEGLRSVPTGEAV